MPFSRLCAPCNTSNSRVNNTPSLWHSSEWARQKSRVKTMIPHLPRSKRACMHPSLCKVTDNRLIALSEWELCRVLLPEAKITIDRVEMQAALVQTVVNGSLLAAYCCAKVIESLSSSQSIISHCEQHWLTLCWTCPHPAKGNMSD